MGGPGEAEDHGCPACPVDAEPEAIDVMELERTLEQWHQRCPICYVQTMDDTAAMHAIAQCPQPAAEIINPHVEKMVRTMKDERKYV